MVALSKRLTGCTQPHNRYETDIWTPRFISGDKARKTIATPPQYGLRAEKRYILTDDFRDLLLSDQDKFAKWLARTSTEDARRLLEQVKQGKKLPESLASVAGDILVER